MTDLIMFQPGDGATVTYWSDRRAGTIAEVRNGGRTVTWRPDLAIRTDDHGMSDDQRYRYVRLPDAPTKIFTRRKNGQYVQQGDPMRGGSRLVPGRHEHYDYSF